jgi:predicted dehydrogenase
MPNPLSRRNFIQNTLAASAAGAAFFIGNRSKAADEAKPADAPTTAPSKYAKMNVAFIGVGGKGESAITTHEKLGTNIVALCDIDAKTLGKTAERFPKAKTWSDWRQMLDKQARDIDAIVISIPDHNHAVTAMAGMVLGKHVYCEKPLTHNVYEARRLVQAARDYRVATQMGNQGHSSDGSAEQVEFLNSGQIGDVTEIHAWTNRPIWPQGVTRPTSNPPCPETVAWDVWLGPAPERPYNPAYHPFSWRGWWDFGTGALGDMACHILDTSFWALGLKDPIAIESFGEGATDESPPKWSIIRYDFPARNGKPAMKLFWYDGKMLPPYDLLWGKQVPDKEGGQLFIGEKGRMLAPYNREPVLLEPPSKKNATTTTAPSKPERPKKAGDQTMNFLERQHTSWLEAILGGPPAGANFDYAGPLTELVLLGNLSLRTGKRIEWDGPNMRVTNVPEANQYVKREYRSGWSL